MNKLSEKISPVMNAAELQQLVTDHYLGESQLLTSGSEENLLKLGELREVLDATQLARWEQIKRDFMRDKAMGGDDADTGARMVAQLADIASGLQGLRAEEPAPVAPVAAQVEAPWEQIVTLLQAVAERPAAVVAAPPAAITAPRATCGSDPAVAGAGRCSAAAGRGRRCLGRLGCTVAGVAVEGSWQQQADAARAACTHGGRKSVGRSADAALLRWQRGGAGATGQSWQ